MIQTSEILDTLRMIDREKLDVRTITMGISLFPCVSDDIGVLCRRVYDRITRKAERLVAVGEEIEREFGVPIVNKRISVTPAALISGGVDDPVPLARALDDAAKATGVDFIGGYSALVQKGMTDADRRLIESIPEALATTRFLCSSVNVASTRAGIDMDAVALLGKAIKKTAELTKDNDGLGCAKFVAFANAVEDNPFMAGAFHGPGEGDAAISVGVSGPGVVKSALEDVRASPSTWWPRRSSARPSASPASANWWPAKPRGGWACPLASSTSPSPPPRRWATRWRRSSRRWGWRSAARTAPRRRWRF